MPGCVTDGATLCAVLQGQPPLWFPWNSVKSECSAKKALQRPIFVGGCQISPDPEGYSNTCVCVCILCYIMCILMIHNICVFHQVA